jgi:trehalose 6-phosphate phosphatase
MFNNLLERLWIFDFDGTLAPLVPERDKAKLHPISLSLLYDLKEMPGQRVAVLSSRHLDDLVPRIPLPGLFLSGGSGMEWQLPDGPRLTFGDRRKLDEIRNAILPRLKEIASLPGIELEDKEWSVAFHTRNADQVGEKEIFSRIEELQPGYQFGIFKGPEVIEVHFMTGVDKSYGVRTFCQLLKFDPSEGEIVYVGDDTNDARAMEWVDYLGGITVTVGDSPLISGSRVVGDQIALADEIREIAGLVPRDNSVAKTARR